MLLNLHFQSTADSQIWNIEWLDLGLILILSLHIISKTACWDHHSLSISDTQNAPKNHTSKLPLSSFKYGGSAGLLNINININININMRLLSCNRWQVIKQSPLVRSVKKKRHTSPCNHRSGLPEKDEDYQLLISIIYGEILSVLLYTDSALLHAVPTIHHSSPYYHNTSYEFYPL